MKTNQTLKEILMEVWDCGYTIDTPDTQGMSVDQALKEISELLVECKPSYKNKQSREYFSPNANHIKAHRSGYMLGVRDYEKNIKDLL